MNDRSDATWRVGSKQSRNIYRDDREVAVAVGSDAEAEVIAKLLVDKMNEERDEESDTPAPVTGHPISEEYDESVVARVKSSPLSERRRDESALVRCIARRDARIANLVRINDELVARLNTSPEHNAQDVAPSDAALSNSDDRRVLGGSRSAEPAASGEAGASLWHTQPVNAHVWSKALGGYVALCGLKRKEVPKEGGLPCPACMEKIEERRVTDAAAAYVYDRAHQYDGSSGTFDALVTVAHELAVGEHLERDKHGELDDGAIAWVHNVRARSR